MKEEGREEEDEEGGRERILPVFFLVLNAPFPFHPICVWFVLFNILTFDSTHFPAKRHDFLFFMNK